MDNKNHIMFETEGIAESNRVLYTPGEFTKRNLLYVQEAGCLTSLSSHKSAHKELDSYLLMEVIKGSGIVAIGDREYRMNAGDAILVNCNNNYYHISDDHNPWTIAWVHFNGYAAPGYYEIINSYCNDKPVLSNVLIKQLVDEILPLLHEEHLSNELTVSEKLHHTLNSVLRQVIKSGVRKSNINWNHIREYVNKKCMTDDFEIQNYFLEIEQKFNITETETSEGFVAHFGIDLNNYVEYRKLSIVKEKLRFTTQEIDDIATGVGIKDGKVFVEIFKRHENMTPSEYRRSWAQWIRS